MFLNFILLSYTSLIVVLIGIVFKQYKTNQKLKEIPLVLPNLSIVIPFRNEAEHLESLIKSLSQQQYPGFFEIVFVDDHSSDSSVEIIKKNIGICQQNIVIVKNTIDTTINLTSKQQAIHTGIQNAQYEFIVLTDADMQYDIDWLVSLGKEINDQTHLAFGHTAINFKTRSLFEKLQAFQLDFLFSVAYSLFHAGITGSCMGNNMIISRSKYLETGGQKSIGYSIVEDRALFSQFKKNRLKCAITSPFVAKAFTYPCTTLTQFYHQMRRWARGGFSIGSVLFPIGILFGFQNTLFCASFFKILSVHTIIIVTTNFFITWFFTAVCFRSMNSKNNILLFPIFFLFLIIESITFIVSLLIFPTITWKGRALKK
jgi:cellulose synthase/poly-beta-1,6-N-acetylglucosamine synthase-like glycosyltransferase